MLDVTCSNAYFITPLLMKLLLVLTRACLVWPSSARCYSGKIKPGLARVFWDRSGPSGRLKMGPAWPFYSLP